MSLSQARVDDIIDAAKAIPFTPMVKLRHLLRVAGCVSEDANKAWAEVWAQLKACADGAGCVTSEAEAGFVPASGWPEFLEKFWQIKFYLDCIQRVCNNEH